MVDSFPPSFERNKCRAYLMQYTSRLIAESRSDVVLNSLEYTGSMESEMNGFLATLNELTALSSSSELRPANAIIAVPPMVAATAASNSNTNTNAKNRSGARPADLLLSESYAAGKKLSVRAIVVIGNFWD